MKSCTYWRLLFVMRVIAVAVAVTVAISMVGASDVQSQTLFARPDTAPNYRSYHHIEECWSAALRISDAYETIRDSIWWDTIPGNAREEFVMKRRVTRRPKIAIDTANLCLEKFNADTATFLSPESALRIVKILLVAHRDQDAHRLAQRLLDSLRLKAERKDSLHEKSVRNYKAVFYLLMNEYGNARPIRYDEVKHYYAQALAAFTGDSLYYRIDVARAFAPFALLAKDTVEQQAAEELALRLNDSTPEEERRKSPGAFSRLPALAKLAANHTQDEALDSLAISTAAYNLWYANTVRRRVYGGEGATREEVVAELEKWKQKLSQLSGEHYYIATTATSPSTSSQGVGTYTSNGILSKGMLPIKSAINYFTAMSTLCQIETSARTEEDARDKPKRGLCLQRAAEIRYVKQEFPDIEIIGLSNTYGTVGVLGPLTPDENADTLAKLLLGFHRLPIRLVVENTEFYHLAEPDGRRIDINTPNSEVLGMSVKEIVGLFFTDKEGYVLKPWVNNEPSSDWFKRFYLTLKNRPSK